VVFFFLFLVVPVGHASKNGLCYFCFTAGFCALTVAEIALIRSRSVERSALPGRLAQFLLFRAIVQDQYLIVYNTAVRNYGFFLLFPS